MLSSKPASRSSAITRRPLVEPVAAEREPEVDHVRARVAVVLGEREDAVAVEARDVVDLGEHADVALSVARARVGLAEPGRQRLEVRGALLGRDPEALAQDVDRRPRTSRGS